jgi:hypothetical protein
MTQPKLLQDLLHMGRGVVFRFVSPELESLLQLGPRAALQLFPLDVYGA